MPERDLCGCTLGEFVLRERLKAGRFSDVYRGEQLQLGRDVVVRVLHQPQDDDALQCFMREAQLDHPYVAHVYAFGVKDQDGAPWIAGELVPGVRLSRWLETHGPMPLEQVVPLFESIAHVVQSAHDHKIVHRNLNPSTIMVIEGVGRLFPKLLDFGIDHLTHSAAGVKYPAYTAPEQWSNAADVGPEADIYALGIVAYEALTGHVPFVAETLEEYDQRHHEAPVPPLGGDGSQDLDRILQRALAKNPQHRHGSVLELASELRAALRKSQPEQLRSSAQQWDDRGRPSGLLWGGDVLANVERKAPSVGRGELERSFIAEGLRHVRRAVWGRRLLRAFAAMIVLSVPGVFLYRSVMQSRMDAQQSALQARAAEQLAEATVAQAELEQGRSALLHGEPDAQLHLGRAYHRGDHSPSTAFMFARALQPKLAEQARFASSFGRMWSASFSPDGRQIVTTDDRGAQVRDAQTYRLLFELPHGDTVYQAVYSADGTKLVTAGGDGAVRIWDAVSGALVRELRRGSAKPRYYAVALSSDGKLVAGIDTKGEVADIWDAATGAPIAEIRNDASEWPAIAFSADGRWLVTTGGNDVRVFDTQTRAHAITIRGPRIHSLAFDPTGPRLVTGAATGDAAIWGIPSGALIRHLREIGAPVEAVAFSPDGQFVVAADRDGAEQVWHAGSGKLQSQFNPRHRKILAVEFDRTSKLVLAAGADGTVVVADAVLGMPVTVLEGRKMPYESRISTRARAASSGPPGMAQPGSGMRRRPIAAGARHR